jgi:hypothetical protein
MSIYRLGLLALACATSLILTACNQKKSSPGVSTQCLTNPYTGVCDNSYYGNASGFTPYPGVPGYSSNPYAQYGYYMDRYHNQYGGLSHLCACPPGSRPVYNGSIGIGCAAHNVIPQSQSVYYHGLLQYLNIPQISNVQVGNGANGCYNNVAWSCVIGQVNQCPAGTTCKSSGNNNSPIGICAQ